MATVHRCPEGEGIRDLGSTSCPYPSRSPLSDQSRSSNVEASRRRVQAIVALRLLEVMRDQDLPVEVLEEEDPAVTMPRRLGLSEVVERQIRSYREDVRRRFRLSGRALCFGYKRIHLL